MVGLEDELVGLGPGGAIMSISGGAPSGLDNGVGEMLCGEAAPSKVLLGVFGSNSGGLPSGARTGVGVEVSWGSGVSAGLLRGLEGLCVTMTPCSGDGLGGRRASGALVGPWTRSGLPWGAALGDKLGASGVDEMID